MTSVENNEQTVKFFEDMNYFNYPKEYIKFFIQAEEPLLDKTGKLLIGEDKTIRFASNGNGEIYRSLKKTNMIQDMRQKGIEWILVIGIDNILVNAIDPLFIGLTLKDGNSIASKSIAKKAPKESGGVFAKTDGTPKVIEYVEVSDEIANRKDEDGEFIFGDMNIVNHLFRIDAIEKLADKDLPYHTTVKNCKHLDINGNMLEDKIYKFEKFIFDGFVFFDDMSLLRVKREDEFAPIKNKEGEDSPATAKKLYEDYINRLKK